jgi:hypothetical protein
LPAKNKSFSWNMYLKNHCIKLGLKLSNGKPRCKNSALHFSVEQIPPMLFSHRAHRDQCFLQLLISELTPVSPVESELGYQIVTQPVVTAKAHLHIYSPSGCVKRQMWHAQAVQYLLHYFHNELIHCIIYYAKGYKIFSSGCKNQYFMLSDVFIFHCL